MDGRTTHQDTTPTGLTIDNREFARLAGISEAVFYRLKKDGKFKGLGSGLKGRWSRAKVIAFLNEEPRRKGRAA